MNEFCHEDTCGDNYAARKQRAISEIIGLEAIAAEALTHMDYANAGCLYGIIDDIKLDYSIPSQDSSLSPHSTAGVDAEARRFFEARNDY